MNVMARKKEFFFFKKRRGEIKKTPTQKSVMETITTEINSLTFPSPKF
jgi:hypothetical protein